MILIKQVKSLLVILIELHYQDYQNCNVLDKFKKISGHYQSGISILILNKDFKIFTYVSYRSNITLSD